MSKMKIKARKLSDPDVKYISLVSRGANRIPIRIMKKQQQENGMIDIGKIFKSAKNPSRTPTVIAALAVEKREDMLPVREAIQKAGFKVDDEIAREDGAVLYVQTPDFDEANCTVYKVNGDILALISGSTVHKSEDKGFVKDLFGEFGYVPSAEEACVAVCQSVLKEAGNVDDTNFEDYMTLVKSDLGELAEYIGESLQIIPASLTELELPKAVTKDGGGEDEGESEEDEPLAAESEEASAGAESIVAKEEASDVSALITAALAPFAEQISGVMTAVKGVSDAVIAVQKSQVELAEKVGEVEAVAKSANDAVGGKVLGSEPAPDKAPKSRIVKAEDTDPRSGQFDTAFLPNARH